MAAAAPRWPAIEKITAAAQIDPAGAGSVTLADLRDAMKLVGATPVKG